MVTASEALALLPTDASLRDLVQLFADSVVGERLLTPEEAAEELKVSRSTIYEFMIEGLPWCPVNGRGRRIYHSELHDWYRARGHGEQRSQPPRAAATAAKVKTKSARTRAGANARAAADAICGGTDRASLLELVRGARRNGGH